MFDGNLICHGNSADHCCYFGAPCKYVEENTVPGRHWACGLYLIHGTWDAVYQTQEFTDVLNLAVTNGLPETYRCGDWPPPGESCAACGGINNG